MQVTTQIVTDGARNLVVHLTGYSDDGAGENAVTKVDVTGLTPPCSRLRLQRINGSVNGGSVRLLWDGDTPAQFAVLAGGQVEVCHPPGRGLNNEEVGTNGNVLLSTVGFDTGAGYDLTLEFVKKA